MALLRAWVAGCRIVGALTILGFLLVVFTPAPNFAGRRLAVPSDVGPAEGIVVLGGFVNVDGSLGDSSQRRALEGIRLHRQGLAPRLLFFGLHGEAETRARLAVDLGVDRAAILTENDEPTTRGEAARAATVLGQRLGVRTILLVTDASHMRRARALFERVGFTVRPVSTDAGVLFAGRHEDRLRLARVVGQELVALGYHRLFGYL